MAILQLRSRRKSTGGRYKRPTVKRLSRLGRLPTHTKIGALRSKVLRVIGANTKSKLLAVDKVNLYNPDTKKHEVVEVKNIVENPANRHFVRRNILTKGAIIETAKGRAQVTSRPGQSAQLNAVLIK